jgi:hypothetical protein
LQNYENIRYRNVNIEHKKVKLRPIGTFPTDDHKNSLKKTADRRRLHDEEETGTLERRFILDKKS